MMSRTVAPLMACVLFVCISHGTAHSAELKIFASRAIWTVLTKSGPEFEKNSGHSLNVSTGLSSEFVRRINAGETFDVIAAPPAALDGLINSGKVAPDSKTNLARSAYGVAIRAGALKPDISSVEAFKRSLLAAKSIAYPDPATGAAVGIYFVSLLERLGVAAELKPKSRSITAVAAMYDAVAKGDVEIGLGQRSEILAEPRVELVDLLPAEIQSFTLFAAGIVAGSEQQDAGKALIRFISSPAAQLMMKAKGFEAP